MSDKTIRHFFYGIITLGGALDDSLVVLISKHSKTELDMIKNMRQVLA